MAKQMLTKYIVVDELNNWLAYGENSTITQAINEAKRASEYQTWAKMHIYEVNLVKTVEPKSK